MYAEAEGDDARALVLYLQAGALEPGNAEVLRRIGAVFNRLGEHKKALPILKRAVRLEPGEAEGYSELGIALQREGFLGLAEQALRQGVELRPTATALCRLADILWDQKRLEAAVEALNAAVRIDPECREAYICLGLLLRELRKPSPAGR